VASRENEESDTERAISKIGIAYFLCLKRMLKYTHSFFMIKVASKKITETKESVRKRKVSI